MARRDQAAAGPLLHETMDPYRARLYRLIFATRRFISLGLLGKVLGPIGRVATVRSGEWPRLGRRRLSKRLPHSTRAW